MFLRDPLRYLWDLIAHPKTSLFLFLFSAIAVLFSPFVLRVMAGLWLLYLSIRMAEETASWLQSRNLSPRESLKGREDFKTIIVSSPPDEIAARLPSLLAPPFWKMKVYRERTRYYFEARGIISIYGLKWSLFTGAFIALLGLLLAPVTDKAVESPMVPGDTISLEDKGFSFRLEEVSTTEVGGEGVFLAGNNAVKSGKLAPGRPLLAGSFLAMPVGRNPALEVKVKGGEPFVLYPGGKKYTGEVTVPFLMPNDEKYLFLPTRRLILRLVLIPKSEDRFLLEVFREGAERSELKMEIGKPEELNLMGVEVSFTPTKCLKVKLARVISLWLVTVGFSLAAVTLLLWSIVPVGKIFGFIQREEKSKVNWVQEDPLKFPPFVRIKE